ncbi:MAG: c-type cytochrome [Planctomycetes bacterium]|nr:c-type cytochrome [Planctomycetota bacterium]
MRCGKVWWLACLVAIAGACSTAQAQSVASDHPGYRLLTTKAYLPSDFDQEVFDQLWQTWSDDDDRRAAENATLAERRRLTLARYGLYASEPLRAEDATVSFAQYARVPPADQQPAHTGWAMHCLVCHGGAVNGQYIPGLPNAHLDLQSFIEDVRATKLRLGKTLSHMDKGLTIVPLGSSVGTTNAVVFGKLLLGYRDAELKLVERRIPPSLPHHDMDAPAWWHLKRKQRMYIDGFAPKTARALMQFLLIPRNKAEHFRAWEGDYAQILAWIETIEPPKYPWPIDRGLAEQGRAAFNRVCAECHGTYGEEGNYPERCVSIDELGTDRVRFDALAGEGRQRYSESWFAQDAKVTTVVKPIGYVAPPLDGVWATAPYFHNGSVPTLWHVLRADQRPAVWKRSPTEYDQERVGLKVVEAGELPDAESSPPSRRRRWYNTEDLGKSAAGHRFPDALTEAEKRAVLEYLKTL